MRRIETTVGVSSSNPKHTAMRDSVPSRHVRVGKAADRATTQPAHGNGRGLTSLCLRLVASAMPATVLTIILAMAGCDGVGMGVGDGADTAGNDVATDDSDSKFDSLSMPATPTLSVESFRSAEQCKACHPRYYSEWKTAMHAYATKDPVWRALITVRQADFEGKDNMFCVQCHSAIGTRGGEVTTEFAFDDWSPIMLEGVTCEACHKAASIERVYNSGLVLDENGPLRGPIKDPVETGFHESEYSEMFDTSEFCGSCHDVIEQEGLVLESAFVEWEGSPAAAEGRNCQSCHMPTYTGKAANLDGVPERDNLHSHRFIGVDLPLTDDFIEDPEVLEEIRGEVKALLASAGEIELAAVDTVSPGDVLDVSVTVRNLVDAHNLPTGATFNRQLWIELTATDADGAILYQTGHLDDNGDLRMYGSELDAGGDPDLATFQSKFFDKDGNRTVFPWRATEHVSDALSPLEERTIVYSVPTDAATTGPISIEARLLFRQAPPFIVRALGLGAYVGKLEIHEIHTASMDVGVE